MFILSSIMLALFTIFLGIIVYLREPRDRVNQIFFAVTIASVVWALNYQYIESYSSLTAVDFSNGLSYVLGILLIFLVVWLSFVFPVKRPLKFLFWYSMILSIVAILSPTIIIKGTVTRLDDGTHIFNEGPLGILYIIALLIGIVLVVQNLYLSRASFNPIQKLQSQLMAIGFFLSFVIGISLSMVLTQINPDSIFIEMAPFSIVFFVATTTIAMLKHKLFDFKAVIIRAVGYVFVTAFVVVVYVTGAFFIKRILFPELQVTSSQLISNILLAIILVTTFPMIKRRFDKFSNRVFFQDSYDPQELIDRLNQTLVSNVNLEELLTKIALIIQEEMKISYCTFYIRETSYIKPRILGAHRSAPEYDNVDLIKELSSKLKKKIFAVNDQEKSENKDKLRKAMKDSDIEILARLTNTIDYEVQGIGFIFFGAKKSGSQYTDKDLKILEIIANELVIAIENVLRFEEIENFNVTLQKKIDDATKELKDSNEKLKALDEAKDEFVSMASHQLRTPLTSIKGYISMVLEEDAGKINETQKKMLGQAFFSSQRMVYLISDLLNVSRLKTGKFIIEPRPVNLADIVDSELKQLQEGAAAKNQTLAFDKPDTFPMLNLDDMKIRQVVMNFTDNAIYYTPQGGKISIELKDKKDSIEFTVKDSGIGVPKNEQHKLFAKFFRAENARKARPDGTGLGLFMAKKVVVAQGGAVIFSSKENKGSTFGFSFPKSKLEVIQK